MTINLILHSIFSVQYSLFQIQYNYEMYNTTEMERNIFQRTLTFCMPSVGDDKINIVRNYIAKQEEHHKKISFSQEYDKFIARYGFDIVKR